MARRSTRKYTLEKITDEDMHTILKVAVATPSGKNYQLWKFKAISDRSLIEQLSLLTEHGVWLKISSCLIAVFLDEADLYDYI